MSTETVCETEPDALSGTQRLRRLFEVRTPTTPPSDSAPQPNRADLRRFGMTNARQVRHGSRSARRRLGRPYGELATYAFTLKVLPDGVADVEEAVYVAYAEWTADGQKAVRDAVRAYVAAHPGAQVLGIGDDRKKEPAAVAHDS